MHFPGRVSARKSTQRQNLRAHVPTPGVMTEGDWSKGRQQPGVGCFDPGVGVCCIYEGWRNRSGWERARGDRIDGGNQGVFKEMTD